MNTACMSVVLLYGHCQALQGHLKWDWASYVLKLMKMLLHLNTCIIKHSCIREVEPVDMCIWRKKNLVTYRKRSKEECLNKMLQMFKQ